MDGIGAVRERRILAPIAVFAIASSSASSLLAVAPMEAEIVSVSVLYANGSNISTRCSERECVLKIVIDSREFTFGANELTANIDKTAQPVLFSEKNVSDSFGFQLHLDCNEKPFLKYRAGPCFGNYTVTSGAIDTIHKFVEVDGRTFPAN